MLIESVLTARGGISPLLQFSKSLMMLPTMSSLAASSQGA